MLFGIEYLQNFKTSKLQKSAVYLKKQPRKSYFFIFEQTNLRTDVVNYRVASQQQKTLDTSDKNISSKK